MLKTKNIVLAALLGFMPIAMADTYSIINEPNGVERPKNGMSMDQVKAKFGAANEEKDPVGEPPISRWVYNDFTVYYEHQLVIHSVAHKHNGAIGSASASSTGDRSDTGDRLFLLD